MKTCYLRYESDSLDNAEMHASMASACSKFLKTAKDLDRYGQRIEASIHIAAAKEELNEYPDYVLSLGPRGGLRKQTA